MQSTAGIPAQKIVLAEIHALLIALRTNSRFSSPARFKYEILRNNEKKLILGLKDLREVASSKTSWQSLTIMDVLNPFFDIIVSEDTTGPITGVALQSIQKFLEHPCITSTCPGAKYAMEEIVKAVKHCQFEVTDAVTDEAVLTKILQVFVACVRCEASALLEEGQILEIMKSCFRIGRETRPTELLRRSAENSLQEITEIVVKRIRNKQCTEMTAVFEFICDLCDPEKEGKSASLRLLGLTLANSVLEFMGTEIQNFPGYLNLAKNNLSRALLRNSSTSNIVVLSQTLRAMHSLIACAAAHIHEQIEGFIISTHLKIADNKQSPPEHVELVLESLVELCSDSSFVFLSYEHYDCAEYSTNLFETICSFLSRNIKESESLNTLHILALNGLLGTIHCIADRTQYVSEDGEFSKKLENIRKVKEAKRKMMDVAAKFNQDPKQGIALLKEYNGDKITAKQASQFMREYANWLSKNAIGECLKVRGELYQQILLEYMNSFNFKGMPIDSALRYLVNEFKLSGEGQQISQILQYFGDTYYKCNQEHTYLANAEASWAFAVAVLLLHTDLHNGQNRYKMTLQQWISNTSQINESLPMPKEELERIYADLSKDEFQFSTNFYESYKSDLAWKHLLQRSQQYFQSKKHRFAYIRHQEAQQTTQQTKSNELTVTTQNAELSTTASPSELSVDDAAYDCDLFLRIWGNVMLATSIVLENTEDESVLRTAIHGYLSCARIASNFKLSNVFDNLVISLCKFTKALDPNQENAVVTFGNSERSQLAARTVFAITRKFGDNLREGWKNILELILRMYEHDLLPENVIERESFVLENSKTYMKKKKPQAPVNTGSGFGIFGFFGSNDDSLAQKQAIEKAQKCVEQCHIPDMLRDVRLLHESSLEYLVKALMLSSSGISLSPSSSVEDEQNRDIHTALFSMDLLIHITISNKERVETMMKPVFDHLKARLSPLLGEPAAKLRNLRYVVILERVVVSILTLYIRLLPKEEIRAQLDQIFELLTAIPDHAMATIIPQTCAGILQLIKTHSKNIRNAKTWDIILKLLRQSAVDKETSVTAIQITSMIVQEGDFVWPDNIPSCVVTMMSMATPTMIDLLYSLHNRMFSYAPSLSNPSPSWTKSWFSILEGLVRLCTFGDKEVRNAALINIQRILLDKQLLSLPPTMLDMCIGKIFALMDDLLVRNNTSSPNIALSTSPPSRAQPVSYLPGEKMMVEETRLRAVNILAKTFLQYLSSIQQMKEFPALWIKIMKYMQQFNSLTDSDLLPEAIPELLKNMILVINAHGIFKTNQELWNVTKQQTAFVSSMMEELIAKIEKAETPTATPESSGTASSSSQQPEGTSATPAPTVE